MTLNNTPISLGTKRCRDKIFTAVKHEGNTNIRCVYLEDNAMNVHSGVTSLRWNDLMETRSR